MDLPQKTNLHVEAVADESLSQFEKISTAAEKERRNNPPSGAGAFASINTMTSGSAVRNLGEINQDVLDSYQVLTREPAIARVKVVDEEGELKTYYICRTTPISGIDGLAGYLSPIGRLASLPIGDELILKNGHALEVVESTKLHPLLIDEAWDSKDTTIEGDNFGPITIESLRVLLNRVKSTGISEDLLNQIRAEEIQKENVIEGMRRSVISKMGLRDQPILDQHQDEIFRLPLETQLLILGPPGTGKTTTLIRRLGQKLDVVYLENDEKRIIESINLSNLTPHSNSWLMFTPTKLLKQYLKEAFNREGVPAPEQRISTWADYRQDIARNTLGVLRTASGGGPFVLRSSIDVLAPDAHDDPIAWYSNFDEWQRSAYIRELRKSGKGLSENQTDETAVISQRILPIVERASSETISNTVIALAAEAEHMRVLVSDLKKVSDKKIDGALNIQINSNSSFLDELAEFVDGLEESLDAESDEPDDLEGDDEEVVTPRAGRSAAIAAYIRAVRTQARVRCQNGKLGTKSRAEKIIEWLGNRALSEEVCLEVGESLLVQDACRYFSSPVKRYMSGIIKRYRAFRRQLSGKKGQRWYSENSFKASDLHPMELDIVLLAILRTGTDLLSKRNVMRDVEAPVWSSLKPVLDLYRNQVLVDEVTDFSPIQVACMSTLAHPSIRSFVACGDFNQRLTTWGMRSVDDAKWALPNIAIKPIDVSYRQTRKLNELARSIIMSVGGVDPEVKLPKHVKNEGYHPALLEGAQDNSFVVSWLAERICEIERALGQLPSIAVFVECESKVEPLADALNEELADQNAQVEACLRGQVIGQDSDVRVFDVQHIKGLEFEAVFFVGVDRLAELHPKLFDKYLYVGITRAATYLGVTCDDVLPTQIESLRPLFISDWGDS